MSEFNFNTIEDFDGHIAKSIIGYDTLYKLIYPLASNYIVPGCNVVDLGCSSGEMLRQLSYRYKDATYIGYDTALSNLLKPGEDTSGVTFYEEDILSPSFEIPKSKLILSLFTLQFLPPEKRVKVLLKIRKSLLPGGAFILAEKIYCKTGSLQDSFQFAHYDLKRLNFSAEEILEKQRDIRVQMKLQTEEAVNNSLNSIFRAAFGDSSNFELFWASYNFRAWIIEA